MENAPLTRVERTARLRFALWCVASGLLLLVVYDFDSLGEFKVFAGIFAMPFTPLVLGWPLIARKDVPPLLPARELERREVLTGLAIAGILMLVIAFDYPGVVWLWRTVKPEMFLLSWLVIALAKWTGVKRRLRAWQGGLSVQRPA